VTASSPLLRNARLVGTTCGGGGERSPTRRQPAAPRTAVSIAPSARHSRSGPRVRSRTAGRPARPASRGIWPLHRGSSRTPTDRPCPCRASQWQGPIEGSRRMQSLQQQGHRLIREAQHRAPETEIVARADDTAAELRAVAADRTVLPWSPSCRPHRSHHHAAHPITKIGQRPTPDEMRIESDPASFAIARASAADASWSQSGSRVHVTTIRLTSCRPHQVASRATLRSNTTSPGATGDASGQSRCSAAGTRFNRRSAVAASCARTLTIRRLFHPGVGVRSRPIGRERGMHCARSRRDRGNQRPAAQTLVVGMRCEDQPLSAARLHRPASAAHA
jgi:hypothetical protein